MSARVPPDCAEAFERAVGHHRAGHKQEAYALYEHVAAACPTHHQALFLLGALDLEQARPAQAAQRLEQAVQLFAGNAAYHSNLGLAYRRLGRLEQARVTLARAVRLNPSVAEAQYNLGLVCLDKAETEIAEQCFRRALALKPTSAAYDLALGQALLRLGRVDEAITCWRRALANDPGDSVAHSCLVFIGNFHPKCSAEQNLAAAQAWAEAHEKPLAAKRMAHANERSPDRRLRLGYVSPDFNNHCQRFFTVPVLSQHDHAAFEVICYSSVMVPDQWTARLRSHADEWHEVRTLDDAALAQRIREDGIDVLVDLTMHMKDSRLKVFAEKPAPVQICWLAYPGTTGLGAMDYRITDPYLDPPSEPLPYSERSLHLPHTFWCYDPLSNEPVSTLPALGSRRITFGCLNDFSKVHRGVLELWARVLQAVGDAQLLMLAPPGLARQSVVDVLENSGVGAGRVQFVDRQGHADYLRTYWRIDIGLDCHPVNGHTTSLDAFWMGVPVVTLVGDTVLGRAGSCQARNLGLGQLVAHTPEEFVQAAVELSRDLEGLAALRQSLRERMRSSPLMDAPRFVRDLEGAYRRAWRNWCNTQ